MKACFAMQSNRVYQYKSNMEFGGFGGEFTSRFGTHSFSLATFLPLVCFDVGHIGFLRPRKLEISWSLRDWDQIYHSIIRMKLTEFAPINISESFLCGWIKKKSAMLWTKKRKSLLNAHPNHIVIDNLLIGSKLDWSNGGNLQTKWTLATRRHIMQLTMLIKKEWQNTLTKTLGYEERVVQPDYAKYATKTGESR